MLASVALSVLASTEIGDRSFGRQDGVGEHGTSLFVLALAFMVAGLAIGRYATTGNRAYLILAAAFAGSAVTEITGWAGDWLFAAVQVLPEPDAAQQVLRDDRARLAGDFIQSIGLLLATLAMVPWLDRFRLRWTPARVAVATIGLSLAVLAYGAAANLGLVSAAADQTLAKGAHVLVAVAVAMALVVHLANGAWRARDSDLWLAFALCFWVAETAGIRPFVTGASDAQLFFADLANGVGMLLASIGLVIAVHHLFASAADTVTRIRGIFDTALDGIVTVDECGRIASVNRAATAMFQIGAGSAIGRPLGDFLVGLDADVLQADPARKGDALRDYGHGRRSDRSTFPVEIGTSAFDIHGEKHRAIVIRDVTEQRAFAAMRRARNRELQEFLDAMSTLAAKLTKEGLLEACNQKAVEACGLPLSFMRGRPVWAAPLFNGHPRRAVRLRRAIREAARGTTADYEDVILRRGRDPLHVRIAIRPVRDENGDVKYIVIEATDVSRLVEVEQALRQTRDSALEAARVKSEFLAMMSHELRTPLNGVLGVASLLLETRLDEEQQEYVGLIEHSARGLLAIFNDILDFSKVEAGRLDIIDEDFDLVTLIDGVVDLVAQQARERDLDIGAVVPYDITTALHGDAGRLRQILLNLVSNAVKFTERGVISVEVLTEAESADSLSLRFEVIDTGIGIASDAQARLFTRFSQIDTSSARRFGGTGLGLALSKKLVELMGGSIGVESAPGRGSRFWFALSLRKQQTQILVEPRAVAVPNLDGRRVLIVDDHELDQRIFKVQIERLGATVVAVPSGAEGLAALRHALDAGHPYDLAIVDHHMPGMDGFELGARLAADPALAGLPRVMVSSGPLRGDADRALGLGYRRFLPKPVHRRRLFETLNEAAPQSSGAAVAARERPALPVAKAAADESPTDGRRILVAEDNEVNQLLLLAFLKAGGYQADVAVNGREAVEAVRSRSYALVLMDIHMPVMDGVEATAAIRALDSPARDVPIIAATASTAPGDSDLFLASGMDDFLPKPIRRETLLRMIEKWWPCDTDENHGTEERRAEAG